MFLSPSRRWILKSLICSRAVTAKKSTIKRDARAKLFFCQSKPIALFPFSMASPSSETQGQSVGSGEKAGPKFLLRAKEPLGTDSQRTISKNSSGCRLLIGHKKCFVLLCPIDEHISISSFRVFLHDGYCLDHGLSVVAYRWFSCNLGRHK